MFAVLLIWIWLLPAAENPLKASRLSDDVLIVHGGGANVTVIRTGDGLVAVNSFDSPRTAEMGQKLIQQYFPGLSVKYLINTSYCLDHVGGNQSFAGAIIIGHKRIEDRILDEHKELVKEFGIDHPDIKGYFPTPPSLQISGNISIKLGEKLFDVFYFGIGHTDTDLVVLDYQDRLLVVGDLLFYRKCDITGPYTDIQQWMTILDYLISSSQKYKYVVPGHGPIVSDDIGLRKQRDYLKAIWETVYKSKRKRWTLKRTLKKMSLNQFKDYTDFHLIHRDIERCWSQLHISKIQAYDW